MQPLKSTESAAGALQRVKYSHDAMIDLVIQNPMISQNELALYFNYTPSWVSRIMCSDAFNARLAERRDELVGTMLAVTIEERFAALAMRSLDVLQTKLESSQNPELALRTLEISSKAMGYGARKDPVAQTNVVVMMPGKAASEDAWASAYAQPAKAAPVDITPQRVSPQTQQEAEAADLVSTLTGEAE